MNPEISIVVPVYKTERWLRACVDSVLAQTLGDIELILVDDGSPDGCPAICDEYAGRDRRVKVIHKENGGVCSALIAGISATAAPYIGFVDSDDWVDPTYYETLLNALVRTGADVSVAEYVDVPPDAGEARPAPAQTVLSAPENGKNALYAYYACVTAPPAVNLVSKCNKLYRRSLVLDNLSCLRSGVWHGEDTLMNLAILADCAAVTSVTGGGMYYYRLREGSACHRDDFEHMTDSLADNELAFLGAFSRIIRDKGLEPRRFDAYLGRSAYAAALHYAARRDVSYGEKRRYILNVLASVPPEAPGAYARQRGSLSVKAFCLLLRARILAPCILVCGLVPLPDSRR